MMFATFKVKSAPELPNGINEKFLCLKALKTAWAGLTI